jgi:hypothetical protein
MGQQITKEEARAKFISRARQIADYWGKAGNTPEDAADGAIFSLLVMLDGGSGGMPGFIVIPSPHPDDKDYHQSKNEDWYAAPPEGLDDFDIGGGLHDDFSATRQAP